MIKNLGTDANPKWMVRVGLKRANGKAFVQRQKKNIPNKREAQRIERELYAEVKAIAKNGIQPTWENVVEAFLEDAKKNGTINANNFYKYQTQLNAYSIKAWTGRRIDTISRGDVLRLFEEHLPGRSQSTLRTNLKYISSAFRFAMAEGYCNHNPCSGIKFHVPEPDLRIWNEDETRQFLDVAKASGCEWYPIWAMALFTGMRSGELYALQWKHVDLQQKLIRVSQAWTSKTGIKCTKNRQNRRVPINTPLENLLKELKLRTAGNLEDFVLPRLIKWRMGFQAQELRMFIMGLGLPLIRFHDLRAIFASQLLLSGQPLHVVTSICGWNDLKTAKRYLRLSGVEIMGATESLGFGKAKEPEAEIVPILGRKSE